MCSFLATPESPPDSLKIKLKLAQILTLLGNVPLFQEEVQALLLNTLTKLEEIAKFKESDIHEALIDMIAVLYINEDPIKGMSKGAIAMVMQNVTQISEAVAAFIEHKETRISQKGISNFERLIRMLVKIDTKIVQEAGALL